MASPSTETPPLPTLRDVIGHDDDDDDGYDDHFIAEEEDEEEDEEEWDMSKRMSRLSMEGSDGGDADVEDGGGDDEGEEEEEEEDEFEVRSDVNAADTYRPWPHPYDEPRGAPSSSASLPGTPDRGGAHAAAQSSSPLWAGPSAKDKEYASETEARWPPDADGRGGRRHRQHRRARVAREVWLERAWRMRKQRRQLQEEVPVVVLGGGESPASRGGVAMDMEEVRACRDLGLALPCDWTVEIPCYALSGVDTASSGGNSPASGSWRISSPGNHEQLTHKTPAQIIVIDVN